MANNMLINSAEEAVDHKTSKSQKNSFQGSNQGVLKKIYSNSNFLTVHRMFTGNGNTLRRKCQGKN
jgi:hypothetical protein